MFTFERKMKNVPKAFKQWFKGRIKLEKQVLLYIIWIVNATILIMLESAEICLMWANMPQYVQLYEYAWICIKHYMPK